MKCEFQNNKKNKNVLTHIIINKMVACLIRKPLFFLGLIKNLEIRGKPKELFQINEGGLSIHGGIFTAILIVIIYCKKKAVSFLKLADIMVMSVALAQGIGRVGCDVFGKVMNNIIPGLLLLKYVKNRPIKYKEEENVTPLRKHIVVLILLIIISLTIFYYVQG